MKKKLFYFSMLLFTALGLTGCPGPDPDPEPPKPGLPYEFEYGGHKYNVIQERKSWIDAAEDAVARGGYLVEIGSKGEQDAVYNGIRNAGVSTTYTEVYDGGGVAYVWIGATDRYQHGVWQWNGANKSGSGTTFWNGNKEGIAVEGSYANWGKSTGKYNEPDNYTDPTYSPNGQHAAAIGLANWPKSSSPFGIAGEWNDLAETNLLYYVVEFGSDPLPSSNIVYDTAAGYYYGDWFQTGTANFEVDMYDASDNQIGVWIEGFSALPSSFPNFTLNTGSYTLAATGAVNTFRKGEVNGDYWIGSCVYNLHTKKYSLITGGTLNISRSGNTYTITTNFTGKDSSTGATDTDLKYSYTGTISFTDESKLKFPDIVKSNYTATGIPGFLTTPGPSSWTGQVIPSTGQEQFYMISDWGGKTTDVYCDFKEGEIIMDNYTKVAEDDNYDGYFQALALNASTKLFYVITEDYIVKYNKSTKVMDFTGTYNELPVYVGVVGKDKDTGEIDALFTEMYANAKLTLTPVLQSSSSALRKANAFSYSTSISPEEFKNYTRGEKLEIKKIQDKPINKKTTLH